MEKKEFWTGLGYAVVITALCLSVGSCEFMRLSGLAKIEAAKHGQRGPSAE